MNYEEIKKRFEERGSKEGLLWLEDMEKKVQAYSRHLKLKDTTSKEDQSDKELTTNLEEILFDN